MTNISIPEVNMLKNSSTLAVSVPINLTIKLGFVCVNDSRETYFVDALRNYRCIGDNVSIQKVFSHIPRQKLYL